MEYNTLAPDNQTNTTVIALKEKGFNVVVVNNKSDALSEIKKLIPKGVSVMNGASITLEQIGFVDYLKSGEHGWNNLHEAIVKETDPAKQALLRKQSVLSDYYLGSVHALTQTGEFIIASNTGSQLPHIVFTSTNIVFVISTKKIVPNLENALKRLEEYVVPLENEHMMKKYGVPTAVNKIVIFKNENKRMGRKINVILVKEDLGF
jgi:hypothetical protein